MLSFCLRGDQATDLQWGYVDFVVKLPAAERSRDPHYPYEAVQAFPISRYGQPPFSLGKRTKRAIKTAIAEYGGERLMGLSSLRPSKHFLTLVYDSYKRRA